MIAALYVETGGVYFGRDDVDPWDAPRDARLYTGPYPVVAHPPCGSWSKLRHLYRGDDRDCGPRAVDQVRTSGGVLEHPAGSTLWDYCALPKPGEVPDGWGGWTIAVNQCDWGHVARKRTWLYVVRLSGVGPIPPPRAPTHWASGGGTGRGRVPPGIKVCSAQQRRRTPPAFADWLISLASQAQKEAA